MSTYSMCVEIYMYSMQIRSPWGNIWPTGIHSQRDTRQPSAQSLLRSLLCHHCVALSLLWTIIIMIPKPKTTTKVQHTMLDYHHHNRLASRTRRVYKATSCFTTDYSIYIIN